MVVLVTCKYEDYPIKNKGARVFTTLYIKFSDAQGQITLESVMISSQMLIQAFMYSLLTCHYVDFLQRLKGSTVLGPILPNCELI